MDTDEPAGVAIGPAPRGGWLTALGARRPGLTGIAWALALAYVLVVFAIGETVGGATADEAGYLVGHRDIMAFAGQALTQWATPDFNDIHYDLEYYGLLPSMPAVLLTDLAGLVVPLSPAGEEAVYRFGLHASALAWMLASVLLVCRLIRTLGGSQSLAHFAAGLLLLYPVWLGHGLFNFKDLPFAFAYTLGLHAAVTAWGADGARFTRALRWLVVATVIAGAVKVVSLPLMALFWAAAYASALKHGLGGAARRAVFIAGLVAGGLVYLATPAAWREPVRYLAETLVYLSRHAWPGCTLTAGTCMAPSAEGWSAAHYLALWAAVRLPVLVLLAAGPAIVWAAWKGDARIRIVLAALVVPIVLILVRNSSVYSGLRHVLFLMPVLTVLVALALERLLRARHSLRGGITALATVTGVGFVVDTVASAPYAYVWFNPPARIAGAAGQFDHDYWGYSLAEAARTTAARAPDSLHSRWPHLVAPFTSRPVARANPDEGAPRPAGARVVDIWGGRYGWPEGCRVRATVTRHPPWTREPMVLSYVAQCDQDTRLLAPHAAEDAAQDIAGDRAHQFAAGGLHGGLADTV